MFIEKNIKESISMVISINRFLILHAITQPLKIYRGTKVDKR